MDNINDALTAESKGAHQLEWCGNLSEDGLTPDYQLTLDLLNLIKIPVKVMIRCRPGNFIYTEEEMKNMTDDARKFSLLSGISGLVFGACTKEKTLHLEHIEQVVKASNQKPLTVHKAIDACLDIIKEVRRLPSLPGVRFILSSGGANTALEGAEMLMEMKTSFEGNIIAAGKINYNNVGTLHRKISFTYYHGKHIVH